MMVNDPVPDAASIEYVNNPAIANEQKEYYGVDVADSSSTKSAAESGGDSSDEVPDEAVVFYMSDERAE